MSENENFGFTKFVPGFDFLQNIAKGATQSMPKMPSLSNWVAPTLNVEELDKRIQELKAVHFWLEQNSTALSATIQALEVQKMTLATLRGMNVNMADMANALKLKAADTLMTGVQMAGETAANAASAMGSMAATAGGKSRSKDKDKDKDQRDEDAAQAAGKGGEAGADGAGAKVIDPLQWWGALTQQFQQIASDALKDAAARHTAMDVARRTPDSKKAGTAKAPTQAAPAADGAVGAAAAALRKSAPRKSASAKTAAAPGGTSPARSAGKSAPRSRGKRAPGASSSKGAGG